MGTLTQADALRAAAQLLDAHPELPTAYITHFSGSERTEVSWYLQSRRDLDERETAQAIVRTLGGTWSQQYDDQTLTMSQTRECLDITIMVNREAVCERVVVGYEQVTLPAVEAQPAMPALPERVEAREVVEWRCTTPLLADDQAEAVA